MGEFIERIVIKFVTCLVAIVYLLAGIIGCVFLVLTIILYPILNPVKYIKFVLKEE